MRKCKYIGVFRSECGHVYSLEVSCSSFIQAVILLTADAIRSGSHYQLVTITDEKGVVRYIDDILKISELIKLPN